ncbi:MAG: hypothetical protein N2691_03595 [Patescibacteria group bacterium]|nr:hypothetical protein [Patescibacteria group bacterium]
MSITVKRVVAYEISDSNGYPTIEVEMLLSNGFKIISSVSSDNVINTYGKRELRDNDMSHYMGLGVKNAIALINTVIAPRLIGMNPKDQVAFDNWLNRADPSPEKGKWGVNTTLVLSQVFTKAGAYCAGVPVFKYVNDLYRNMFRSELVLEKVPTPVFGMLAGGKQVDMHEFHIIPSSSLTFTQSYEMAVDIFHSLQVLLDQLNIAFARSLHGELIPMRNTNMEMVDIIFDVLQRKNLKPGRHVFLGLNFVANNYFMRGKYTLKDRPNALSTAEYYDFVADLIGKHSVLLVEDPFASDDLDGWRKLFVNFGEQIYIVAHKFIGDNLDYLNQMETHKMYTSIVLKPSYFGTITDTLKIIYSAKKHEISCMISGDKNDTDDDFIADFAMGVQADFIKFGAPAQGERIAKYNRLLKIEQMAAMQAAAARAIRQQALHATPIPKKFLDQIKK